MLKVGQRLSQWHNNEGRGLRVLIDKLRSNSFLTSSFWRRCLAGVSALSAPVLLGFISKSAAAFWVIGALLLGASFLLARLRPERRHWRLFPLAAGFSVLTAALLIPPAALQAPAFVPPPVQSVRPLPIPSIPSPPPGTKGASGAARGLTAQTGAEPTRVQAPEVQAKSLALQPVTPLLERKLRQTPAKTSAAQTPARQKQNVKITTSSKPAATHVQAARSSRSSTQVVRPKLTNSRLTTAEERRSRLSRKYRASAAAVRRALEERRARANTATLQEEQSKTH